ncbi:hypothetical protein ORE12_003294 [Salmonella enterica subsp. enterica serovar Newport]|nr:hypothetical protein [Salmonella enterica subsp. enterica serovar Newport]ECA9033388.1 hypothetical protein [Salmonella enterica subsp. enterica serovar Newport]ECP4590552.1 hypothetical protein [Salmonella enterica subsp. enterica serovar Newport]EKD3321950.1 hypothetical protein [Salmonella enterica subsp. enterica serovar Newport]
MGSNIIELAKLGHERAAELKASCGAVDVRSLAQLISDLATQLEVQFVRSTNMAVQLANAESKCRELAAENAALNKFIAASCFVQAGEELAWYPAIDHAPETPATDAFLAEVRAQGVEMFAERKNNEMMSLHPDTHAVGSIAAEMSSQVKQLREFAAQLRKGAAL